MTMELPPDILFYKILPRLPAKSLGRFRVVSKQWNSLLRTPLFEKLHLQHATNDHHQNHRKLLVIPYDTPCVFNTVDCEAPEDGLTPSRSLPFDFDPSSEEMKILTSFDGLVCVGITKPNCEDEYSDLILWNPLTGDYKMLSKANSHKECYKRLRKAFGLYYSSCDDDYKLLSVTRDSDAYIYSLKSDSWRKLDSMKELKRIDHRISERWWPSTPLNGKLYFVNFTVISDPLHPVDLLDRMSYSIIRFDTNTEKFTEISAPFFGFPDITCFSHQGCIHVYGIYGVHISKSLVVGVELWRMDGDGDWKKVVVSDPIPNSMYINPLHLMRDGNCLIHSISEGLVYKVDLATNNKNVSCAFSARGMDTSPTGKYIETLVSPNRYL